MWDGGTRSGFPMLSEITSAPRSRCARMILLISRNRNGVRRSMRWATFMTDSGARLGLGRRGDVLQADGSAVQVGEHVFDRHLDPGAVSLVGRPAGVRR